MLIGFIGAPCSGKTTAAARLFAELKDNGVPAEFVVEEARKYIAAKRLDCKDLHVPFELDDFDQWQISNNQFESEDLMIRSSPNSVVVSDSCVLNSALYMNEPYYNSPAVKSLMLRAAVRYDLIFVCAPVSMPNSLDSNRVHDAEQIKLVQEKIEILLNTYDTKRIIHLGGSTNERLGIALAAVYDCISHANDKNSN